MCRNSIMQSVYLWGKQYKVVNKNLRFVNKAQSLQDHLKHDTLQQTQDIWAELCQVTLAQLTLSNCRRGRDVQRI